MPPNTQVQIVRKRLVIKSPRSVRVVTGKPTKTPSSPKRPQPKQTESKQQIPPQRIVSRQKHLRHAIRKNKPATVRYITHDITPDHKHKIAKLRGFGQKRILVIMGNGPSLMEIGDLGLLAHPKIDTLAVNRPDLRLWPTTFWAFFDQSQLRRHEDLWARYDGYIFNSTSIKRQKPNSIQLKHLPGKGWSHDLTRGLHIGRSSVYSSMQLALWMAYEKVYIFGVDMNPEGIDGIIHFYGVNPDVDPEVRKQRFAKEAEHYDFAAEQLAESDRAKFVFVPAETPTHLFRNLGGWITERLWPRSLAMPTLYN